MELELETSAVERCGVHRRPVCVLAWIELAEARVGKPGGPPGRHGAISCPIERSEQCVHKE